MPHLPVRYRIQIDCSRENIRAEWFVQFRTDGFGRQILHTDATQCHWFAGSMAIASARQFLDEIRAKFPVTARLFDEYGNIQDDANVSKQDASLSLHNSHEEIIHRRRLDDGQMIEATLVHNKSTKRWYLKFTLNPDPTAPFDQSVSGDSSDQVLERFWSNASIPDFVKQRFIVDESFLQRQPALPVVAPSGTVRVELPDGQQFDVPIRPDSRY